jgi:hypothetical protein
MCGVSIAMKASAVALLLIARAASAQVIIDAHLAKPEFIIGEPIHVVVDVTNLGSDVLSLPACCLDVTFTVPDGTRRTLPSLDPCDNVIGSVELFNGAGPRPRIYLRPDETFSYRSLVRGYVLSAATYELIASGTIQVRRDAAGGQANNDAEAQTVSFTHVLELVVQTATESDLREAFAPYVADRGSPDAERQSAALDAIVEMAPPFLEEIIATQTSIDSRVIDALAWIGTREARTHLKALYAREPNDLEGALAVQAVARLAEREDFDFLNQVLQRNESNESAQEYAALGLGKIGGDEAVRALDAADPTRPEIVRWIITIALGNTRSSRAVDALIERLGQTDADPDLTCGALMNLTRYQWCDDTMKPLTVLRRRWARWWTTNARKVPLFSPADGCPHFPELLPHVR